MTLCIITTGGTLDKIYYDAKNDYHIGEPKAPKILARAGITLPITLIPLLRKDSLELTDTDRALIRSTVAESSSDKFIITHGTDTMTATGQTLKGIEGKTIVLVGSMYPAEFRDSDADFNLGAALMAVKILPNGVYIVMNGCVFDPDECIKNVAESRFELRK